ncbi:MAG TPA: Uma2 family endonuclease [Chitinophagaceae bacterium]|nr:Uma2 family endonuclease [Chitinophagaceae bacterium]
MFTVYDINKDEFTQVEEPDPSLTYTYADYLKWNFEERLELFRGKIFKLSAPNTRHQVIAGDIFVAVKNFLGKQKCQAFIAPFDVRLPVKNQKKDSEVTTVVQPDLCVVCDDSKIDAKGCCGAPDLVVEILSPGNTKKEVKLKHELYQEAGVKEYWIIYPVEQNVVVFILNEDNKFNPAIFYAGDDILQAQCIPGFAIGLNDIFTT